MSYAEDTAEDEPLESWSGFKKPTPTAVPKQTVSFIPEELRLFNERMKQATPEPTPELPIFIPTEPPPPPYVPKEAKVRLLSREQRKRLESAYRKRDRRLKIGASTNQKFEPKFRFCSVQMRQFGDPKEVVKLVKGGIKKQLVKSREKELTSLILKMQCDLVALGGIISKTSGGAKNTLIKQVTTKLSTETESDWNVMVGETQNGYAHQAILFNQQIKPLKLISHTEIELPTKRGVKEGDFSQKLYDRSPLEFHGIIQDLNSNEERHLVLLLFDFKKSISFVLQDQIEPESMRMQMAEIVRLLSTNAISRELGIEDKKKLFIMAGNRVSPPKSPTDYIMKGELHLEDFMDTTICELPPAPDKKNKEKTSKETSFKFSCPKMPSRSIEYFDILGSNSKETERYVRRNKKWLIKKEKKAVTKARLTQTNSLTQAIYLPQDQLFLVRATPTKKLDSVYNAGFSNLNLGNSTSTPFSWANFNW